MVVPILAALWVVSFPEPAPLQKPETMAGDGEFPNTKTPEAAEVAEPGAGVLPGEGPLVVELRRMSSLGETPIRIRRGGSLNGQLLGEGGLPIPFGTVEIFAGPQKGLKVQCDAAGNYEIRELLPGTHLFRIRGGSMVAGRLQRILPHGPTRRNFVMAAPNHLFLKLVGHDGKPLAGARVVVDLGAMEAVTNDEGILEMDGVLRSPRVLVDVFAEGHAATRHELNLMPPNVEQTPATLGPLPQAGRVRGEVKSWPGGPLPTISIVPRAQNPADFGYVWELWQEVPVQSNGFFELEQLPSTVMVDVRAAHPGGVASPAVRSVKPGAAVPSTASFVLTAKSRHFRGTVVDGHGRPVKNARVRLEAEDPVAVLGALYPGLKSGMVAAQLPTPAALRRESVTGAAGRFDFTWADHPEGSGALVLSASAKGYASTSTLLRRARDHVQLTLQPEDRSGEVEVTAHLKGSFPELEWWVEGQPQKEMRPTLESILTGIYEVRISRGDLMLWEDPNFRIDGPVKISLE